MARLAQKPVHKAPAKSEESKAAQANKRPLSAARKPAYMQAKMAMSSPGDAEERQADQVAAEVSRAPRADVRRASLEPGITPAKKDESLAPKLAPKSATEQAARPVPSAARIARMAAGEMETVRAKLQSQGEEEEVQARLFRQGGEEEEPVQARLARLARQTTDDKVQTAPPPALSRTPPPQAGGGDGVSASAACRRQSRPEVQLGPWAGLGEREISRAAQSESPDGQELDADTEARIESLKGQGNPLEEAVRRDMETQFGRDLSAVSIHTDAAAAELCAQIRARAFTVGDDIFFAPGEYAPDSEAGRNLLAHELTHVAQQSSGAKRKVMRLDTPPGGGAGTAGGAGEPPPVLTNHYRDPALGEIDTGETKLIKIKQLRVPTFKTQYFRDYKRARKPLFWRQNAEHGGEERDTDQRGVWEQAVESRSNEKTGRLLRRAQRTEVGGQHIYYFSYNHGGSYLLGSEEDVKARTQRPVWRGGGEPASFHVDHQVEYQLGGEDDIDNMWLLDGGINSSSGTRIDTELETTVGAFVTAVQDKVLAPPANLAAARSEYRIEIDDVTGGLGSYEVNRLQQYYTESDIKQGRQLDALNPMSRREIDDSGLLSGDPDNIDIFPSATGGFRYHLVRDPGGNVFHHHIGTGGGRNAVARQNFEISQVQYDTATHSGNIDIKVPSREIATRLGMNQVNVDPVPILPMTGIEWGGRFDRELLKRSVKEKVDSFPGLSPLHLDDVDLNAGGVCMLGTITPTLPFLQNASVNYSFDGETFTIWKTFNSGEISLPGPIQVSNCSLSLFGSNAGIGVEGRVDFGIEGLGEGFLAGVASATFQDGAGFTVEGGFSFDSELFDPAEIRIRYADQQFTGSGQLGIPEGKISGIRSATIDASFTGDSFTAQGTAELDVPGVEQGSLNLSYSEAEGFAVGGSFTLSPDVPGIRGGSISAELRERPDGEGYSVTARGEAQPDIPGIDSNLIIAYEDGAFSAEFSGAFQRGMLSGEVSVGLTNRTVGPDGQPSGEPAPDSPLLVYGGGSATVQIAPWLQGTAGVRFAPDGEVTVSGEIGLPSQIEIFPRKQIDKDIFSIDIPIPIVPGIFAEVGGGLDAHAGIGPGVIDQLRLGIEYNPAHEENTHVTGDGHVNVPADAGLRLSVHGGIGLGIPAASVSGGLEVGGELGIEGAAEAGVHVDWMPSQGLRIDAYGRLSAHPKFVFDVSGYVEVEALFFTIYENRWQLASFEYGSDMTFGVNFPIRYREGEPFDISLDDVEFQVPEVSATDILGGLIERVI